MIAALLPCPFCGHEHPEFERMGDRRQSCIVICGNCGARHESGDEGSRNGSSWNQRSEPGQDGLRATLETALARIEDMLADDDGQAFKEARKFLESARQLAEQPGFVMVPVGDMAEIKDALDICVSLLESAKSNHLPRIIAAYSKADAIVKPETCDCPAKDMPFGGCCKARPLTASPTDPSTEASEPVGDGTLCGHCEGSGTVLAVTGHLGPNDYEYEAQCEACWGTGSSDLRDAINALGYQPNSVTPGRQMVHRSEVLRIIAARTTPPPAPVLSDAERWRFLLTADHPTVCVMDDESGEWLPVHPKNIQAVVDQAIEAEVIRRGGGA